MDLSGTCCIVIFNHHLITHGSTKTWVRSVELGVNIIVGGKKRGQKGGLTAPFPQLPSPINTGRREINELPRRHKIASLP